MAAAGPGDLPAPAPGGQAQAQQAPVGPKDCLSCRVTGTVVFLAASAYLTAHTYASPPASPIQRSLTLAIAGAFAALGVARALI